MTIPSRLPAQASGGRAPVALDPSLFRPGQALEAVVLGHTADGLTQLKIGDLLVTARLPEPLPPGTVLQLAVKTGGGTPQLVILSVKMPPIPTAGLAVEPGASSQTAAPVTATQQAVVTPGPVAVAPGSARLPTTPLAASTMAGAPVPGPMGGAAAAPSGAAPEALSSSPAGVVSRGVTPAIVDVARGAIVLEESAPGLVLAGATRMPESRVGGMERVVTTPVMAMADASSAPRAALPLAGTPPSPTSPPTGVVVTQDVEPQLAEPNPLLLAQASPQAPPTAAKAVTPPQAALAAMAQEAAATQDSMGKLFVALASAIGKPGLLPEPVLQAAVAVLASRVTPNAAPNGGALREAIGRSGVFLEALLGRGGLPTGDLKAGLMALRGALAAWLGGEPLPAVLSRRIPPPTKGGAPRARAAELAPLPINPREAGHALHEHAEAALSRVKLLQLASLPDQVAANTSDADTTVELPLWVGQELAMAQFKIGADGGKRGKRGERGWQMRFAVDFAATGEIGADVTLYGGAVSVMLWAAEPPTAAMLRTMLPELAQSLEAIGLDPGAVLCRDGVPGVDAGSGHYVDSLR